jgi:hypothetical protein
MKKYHKGFILLPLLIVVIILIGGGYIAYQNVYSVPIKDQNKQTSSEIKTVSVSPTLTASEDKDISDITWLDLKDDERGVSFKYPKGWQVVLAGGGDSMEYDINVPDRSAYGLIGVYSNNNEKDVKVFMAQLIDHLETYEIYKNLKFSSSKNGLGESYEASGDEIKINWGEDYTSTDTMYKFREKGYFNKQWKIVVLHSAGYPENNNEKLMTQVMDSFKLK